MVYPDNKFEIMINQQVERVGNLLEDFSPAVNPPKMIDDPKDIKPDDWVDEAQIQDPSAVKPEDWDENAPQMIPNMDVEKPEDWLEEEPDFVPNPNAVKPEDWDDEEDGIPFLIDFIGDFVPNLVPNPKCATTSGCGPWKRPNKSNPDFKGKWSAPMIDNAAYKGVWKPRQISNPEYFEDNHPSDFEKIVRITSILK